MVNNNNNFKNNFKNKNIYICYVKYERYLLAKIILLFVSFIFNIFTFN